MQMKHQTNPCTFLILGKKHYTQMKGLNTYSLSNTSFILSLNRKEQLEFWWEFFLWVKAIWEIDSSNSAICVDLHTKCLNVIGCIRSSCEIRQVELNLVPAFIESHGHGTDKWLDSGRWLIIRSSESSTHILVIEHLHFEGVILLQVLNDHN